MDYIERYKEKLDNKTATVDDLLEFLDLYMADVEGRHERYEKWRQENKTCQNCKYWTEDGCEYWGDFIDGEDICSQWK